ncbi:hypothetical protein JG688_00007024 [Phytophthora aleatoria]|uniref:Protein kinase domain-containing protein n=1 Tax=Phytophthora aleatoria TaxID=2496075 RepID=A0A8J5J6K0_9STRA|nr:hypothetical protein JG688_00007024 [Phytophthora aleatoria]
MARGLRLLLDASASASSSAPASSSSSSDFPYTIVIGAAVGVLAVILIVVGLFFYCKERKRNKELALEPYVNLAPNPPASQLSPGIATAANQHSVHNSTKLQLSGSMDAHAGFYVMTSPVHTSSLPPAVLKPTDSRGSSSIDQSASFLVSDPWVQKPSFERSYEDTQDLDTFDTSARSRVNSFEDHESFRRAMGYRVGTSLWMAPEVMMGERYDEKADLFSFGVVLSELDSHKLPYTSAKTTETGRVIPDTAILQLVSSGRLSVDFTPPASPALEAMVHLGKACVAFEPDARPTASQALYQMQLVMRAFAQEETEESYVF